MARKRADVDAAAKEPVSVIVPTAVRAEDAPRAPQGAKAAVAYWREHSKVLAAVKAMYARREGK